MCGFPADAIGARADSDYPYRGDDRVMAEASTGLVAVVGWPQTTNDDLVAAWRERGLDARLLEPARAIRELGAGDVAVGRFDVLATLDGVQPGLYALNVAERAGARVVNTGAALLAAHDKLRTAGLLRHARIPHLRTALLRSGAEEISLPLPLVIKPRFGSWGADVFRCDTPGDIRAVLAKLESRPWFARSGAIVQELVEPRGYDLRLVVAAGHVVGAVRRIAAPGEWRTNFSLGGTRLPVEPPPAAVMLGLGAAAAIGADFVGVDLLPTDTGHVVLELNGAVEFDHLYDLPGRDVYCDAAGALGLLLTAVPA
jgi:RimK family alpha-L-glutamate ligase